MPEMTIKEAVSILNQNRWRGRGDWFKGVHLVESLGRRANLGPDVIQNDDAIAIAQGILDRKRIVELETNLAALRLAVEPFVKVARQIPEMAKQAAASPRSEHGADYDLDDLIAAAMPEPDTWRALLAAVDKEVNSESL